MKQDIHPKEYRQVVFIDMSNDYMFLTRSCAPTTETIEVAAGPEAQAALNTANASEAVSDSEATPQAFSRY